MKNLFIFLAGYCTAEVVTHTVLFLGNALPFTAYGITVDVPFNSKSVIFYGVLALIFFFCAYKAGSKK